MFKSLKNDYYQAKKSQGNFFNILGQIIIHSGFRAVFLYRLGYFFRRRKIKILAVLCEKIMHHLCDCWISTNATIGDGFVIRHVGTIVIGAKVKAGKNLDIRQGITIGGNMGKKGVDGQTQPYLGDNILVGVGAVILGPITIGHNSIIGANSVVISNFEDNSIIGGIPGKLIRKNI